MQTRTALSPRWRALAVFLVFAAAFLALGTSDYTRADGALRCLEQDEGGRLVLHGNNHLLYPVWVRAWRALLGAVGVDAPSALQVIRMTQWLMSLLAAGSLALLYDLLQRLATSRAAFLATCLVGTSTAVIVHATSSAEPLPALFAAMAGLRAATAGAASRRWGLLFAAGIMFALALASYQAMATIVGPGVLVLVLTATRLPAPSPARLLGRWLVVVALGGIAGIVAIYGAAYHHEGVSLAAMPGRFFALGGKPEVYAGFTVARMANVPAGLLEQSLDALPAGYGGLRTLAARLTPGSGMTLAIGMALWIAIGWMTLSAWREFSRSRPWWVAGSAIATACLASFPLVYWDPLYDKLWLVPLCGIAIATAMAMAMRRPDGSSRHRHRLEGLVAAVVILQLSTNVPAAVRASTSPTPHLSEAMALRDVVRPGDALILDFDPVSTLWSALYRDSHPALLLPASTRDEAARWLEQHARHATRLVFVSVLDHDERSWNDFIGRRAGIPFDLLEPYRQAATPILRFPGGRNARTVRANYNRVDASP